MRIEKGRANKITNLAEAVNRYVFDGCHISIGGFTMVRNPMAAIYETIRQRIKNLHLYAHSNGQGVDELIGAGCVAKLEIAYGGNGRFASTCVRFRKAVEQGTLPVEDYTNYQMTLRFMAGAMGVPFLPTRSSLGTDIIDKWGFTEAMRKEDPKIPDQKLIVTDNPFNKSGTIPKVVLVPAINTDVAILHVQKADAQGTARIHGLTFSDVEQAKSARHVILTCEEIVSQDDLRADPDQNQIPFFYVDAVVPVPFGAYPTSCHRCYDYDPAYLNEYLKSAQDDTLFAAYLDKYVYGSRDHQAFLEQIGPDRINRLKADPRTGYAVGLDRR
ncbi:MAG: CoA transferase [Thermodesulfobacteriota bacterium]